MEDHICLKCYHSSKRKTGQFLETRCDFFPSVIPQADRPVSRCEKFSLLPFEKESVEDKENIDRLIEYEKKMRKVL